MKDYETAQVSFNLLDYRTTSPLRVWQTCQALAHSMGVALSGSEVIGLIPESCLLEAGSFVQLQQGGTPTQEKRLLVHQAIELMGLNKLKPFDPQQKVLEYALGNVQ
jgi:glutamate formiminotransferase/formiminotetrahydrofolate cyclodeaminase